MQLQRDWKCEVEEEREQAALLLITNRDASASAPERRVGACSRVSQLKT